MQPTDDDLGVRLLGEVQALRNEILMLGNREQARAVKAKLVALHEASRGETVSADVGHIVDEFFTLSKASIVKSYGTAAWDDPETVEEAKARMGRLPAAPGSQYTADQQREGEASLAEAARELGPIATSSAPGPGVLDRVNERVPPPLTEEDLAVAERDLVEGTGHERQHAGLRLLAEVRRLRSDEWLQRAAEEIAAIRLPDVPAELRNSELRARLLPILRKHRDGKA